MTPNVSQKRFVLRKESFGGLLCESRKRRYFRFDEQVFETLKTRAADAASGRPLGSTPKSYDDFIQHAMKKGAIETEAELFNVRIVEHPLASLPKTDLGAPIRVYDYMGYGCNLACRRCLNDSSKAKAEVNRRSSTQSVDIMQKFYEAGTMEWQFTGGEPTYYQEFDEMVGIAKQFGFYILLNTNGVWDEARRDSILASGINEVMLSLDGDPSSNNLLRGKNTYDKIHATIVAISDWTRNHPEAPIILTLNMTYGRQNAPHVEHVIELGARYGANVSLLPERPYGRSVPPTMLTRDENLAFYRKVAEVRSREHVVASKIKISGIMDLFNQNFIRQDELDPYDFVIDYTTCGPYSNSISLLPDGDANICGFFYDKQLPMHQQFRGANMLRDDISAYDAWFDPKIRLMKDATRDMCNTCEFYGKQCLGKCAAIVLADGGSLVDGVLTGEDRYCYAQMVLKQESTSATTLGPVGK
jgi:MoaA/NifB/PqqE/SkfB family radical SAM enzyme